MFTLLTTIFFVNIFFSEAVPISVREVHPDAGLNIIEFTQKYGYPLESHEVQTDDGYILTLHRIPHGLNNSDSSPKPPVLMMHGLLSSSMDWVNMGPEKALGLILADLGYDVWLGNARGNTWSRKHIEIDADENPKLFYNFTFHEIGYYDLPAKIDYILKETGDKDLFYVGHSQGTTSFFIMGSEKPEYNAKIRLMEALGPAVFMGSIPNPLLELLAQNLEIFKNLAEAIQLYEFMPHYGFFTDIGDYFCNDESVVQEVCDVILDLIAGFDDEIDPDFIPVITSNAPAGASISQAWHYLQEVVSKRFCQYDLGPEANLAKYGQDTPPSYDLSKVTAPVYLHYAKNDLLVGIEDVALLNAALPNVKGSSQVPLDSFNHLDFLWAKDVVELLYNDILTEIQSV